MDHTQNTGMPHMTLSLYFPLCLIMHQSLSKSQEKLSKAVSKENSH